ncbi:MAG TPA: hypothetical protein VGR00_12725, partial [Thermoanaerobaculia bacterium]|nr:hypothetical protein [Thermoanaerobaculia bacterium]
MSARRGLRAERPASSKPRVEAGTKGGKQDLPKGERLKALLPDIWALVAPRRGLLAAGLVLMAINRVS